MKVAIIGGGASGLAAAYNLCKSGVQVVVYERAPFLGGQASTFEISGNRIERGYHHLFNSDKEILTLMEEIGIDGHVQSIESKVGTLYKNKIYRFVTPLDLLKFTPLPLVDRLRLGLVTLILKRMKDWRTLENTTAHEWLRAKTGRRAYEVFWEPMLRGKFGEDFYKQIGMPWVWGKIHTRFASRSKNLSKETLLYPYGSFGLIFDSLGEKIMELGGQIHLSRSVTEIVSDAGQVKGVRAVDTPPTWTSPQPLTNPSPLEEEILKSQEGLSMFESCDAVIATVPSFSFAKLIPSLPSEYVNKLTDIQYMSAVLIILALDRPLSEMYWLNIADSSIPFVGLIEHTNLVGAEHYGGNHVVYLSNYLTTDHDMYQMSHQTLLDTYEPHLRKINPFFDQSWINESYYHRVDAAQPIIGTNYLRRIPDHRTPIRGVYLANTSQIYPEDRGTNYSIVIGNRASKLLLDDLN